MKYKLIVLDLHNTIYDEVMEYGLAIDEAIKNLPATRELMYEELSEGHKNLGSDWDDDVWHSMPSLRDVAKEVIEKAISLRHAKSRELTKAYDGAIETLVNLQKRGCRIYIVTEAAADVGLQAIEWLGLAGIVKGVYTYPSRKKSRTLENTYHKPFPPSGDTHLKKPDPELLYQVARDDAAAHNISYDEALASMLYVGDSKYKDGMMARAAGVKFALAAYGKKVKPGTESAFERSKEILYKVTGWDKETLKLTQEASRSKEVDELQPDYILENSLREIEALI